MSKSKVKPAFPGRANSMGYEAGLTKLEWMVTQLAAARMSAGEQDINTELLVLDATLIIKQCELAEKED